jgi:hypothetical protein
MDRIFVTPNEFVELIRSQQVMHPDLHPFEVVAYHPATGVRVRHSDGQRAPEHVALRFGAIVQGLLERYSTGEP